MASFTLISATGTKKLGIRTQIQDINFWTEFGRGFFPKDREQLDDFILSDSFDRDDCLHLTDGNGFDHYIYNDR